MSSDDEFVPLKRVLKICDVSRATLWRVSRSGTAGCPAATKRGGRLYWRGDELDAVKRALEAFEGRTVFDQKRRSARRRAETRHQSLAATKQSKIRGRRARSAVKKAVQDDLFSV